MIKLKVVPRLLTCGSFLLLFIVFSFASVTSGFAQSANLVQLSFDNFNNGTSQHQSEVEPGAFASGNTIVTAFQVARIYSGGGADIGFATSKDGGQTWTQGSLPGLTQWYQGGSNSAASDAMVAYDAKHGYWLISTLPIGNNDLVASSRSADGLTWANPVYVTTSIDSDKNWIVCDNWPSSPYYGNCYTQWDSPSFGDLMYMSTSSDGGATWGAAKTSANSVGGIGGQPLVLPNGTVVVSFADFNGGMSAYTSTNGGASWGSSITISSAPSRGEDGDLRSAGLPSAAQDGGGTIYMSWPDCGFRSGCAENDIVYSTSTDGTHWSAKQRVPIDPVTSTVDHFIHGIGIDPNTAGNSAHIGVNYYFYPNGNCGNSCSLREGYIQSNDGGQTWFSAAQLGGPMQLAWLPDTFSGRMVADYTAVVWSNGKSFPVFALAYPQINLSTPFRESMFTLNRTSDFSNNGIRVSAAQDKPIPGVKGTRVWQYYDLEHRYPIHPGTVPVPGPDED
ncbi:MAG: sialidase family protein [Candidatus Korobacteraceae bacterium]